METKEKLDKKDNIGARRKQNEAAKTRFNLAIVVLVSLGLIFAAMNWDKLIAPFKDAALDVGRGGFPVALPGSTGYVLDEFGENFCLLTDTYLYTYTSQGANIASVQHGFQNPVCSTNNKRIMVYDRNGKGVKCYSRTEELFSVSTEERIVFGAMGNDERCAVVTNSSRYANCLFVYNGDSDMIFRYYSPTKKIMQLCFSGNDKCLYMTLLGEKGGELLLSAARINIDTSTTDLLWETEIGTDVTYSLECTNAGIYIVTSGGSFLLDEESGEIEKQGYFTKEISGIPACDGIRAVVFRDSGSNGDVVVCYNADLEAVNSVTPDTLTAFDSEKGKLYLLCSNELLVYDSTLELVRTYTLDDVYSDVKIIDGGAFLLGYNTVQRIEL